ncbi:hypothetical protein F3Y22_tig00003041pilonHSYRG01329 [Hibiscus syriacus]|uniref:Uncharacterized protein n=1 Tax=Hibiscus syriacus TaxID=106335 RepID=A0A6A3CS15_HIBSY|nr:hypothetical protein F3Y22_tig00003041pilonHSYRG01329 [Hibiscus syriacus]
MTSFGKGYILPFQLARRASVSISLLSLLSLTEGEENSLSLLSSFPHQREAGHRLAAVCRRNPHRRPPHPLPIGANLGKYLRVSKVFSEAWRPVVTPIEVLSSPANRGFIALSRRSSNRVMEWPSGGGSWNVDVGRLKTSGGDSCGLLEAAVAGTWP